LGASYFQLPVTAELPVPPRDAGSMSINDDRFDGEHFLFSWRQWFFGTALGATWQNHWQGDSHCWGVLRGRQQRLQAICPVVSAATGVLWSGRFRHH